MNCQDFQQQIGDALDGALDAGARAALEAHVAGCEACRSVQADLQRLRLLAGTLEPTPPPPGVWPRIAAALEADRRSWWRAGVLPALAAAAVVLLLVAGTWTTWRHPTARPPRTTAAQRAATNAEATASVENEIQQAEEHYNKAITTLEQAATTGSGTLDPQTTAVLQSNLGVIDSAIGESRQALHADPSNEVARQSLFDALRSKVALLEDTVALINEMRKGNQEGAARIVSGMNP